MALAAVAAGADGVMIEVHPKPEEALSLYKKCIEQPRPTTEFWRARIQVGMGQAALSLNRNDVALASLKSADALLHDQPLCKNYSPRLFFKQIYKRMPSPLLKNWLLFFLPDQKMCFGQPAS